MLRHCLTTIVLCFVAAAPRAFAQDESPLRFAWFLDFSPDGKSLVAPYGGWLPTEGGEVRVWDVASGRAKLVLTSPRGVRCAAWSAKGTYFASGNYGGDVVLYHSQTGAKKLEVSTGDTAEFVQITPDERYLIAAAGNGLSWVWEIATGKLMHRMAPHSDSIWGMRIAADSKMLATACKDGTVGVSNIETGEQHFKFEHPKVTIGVAFTADVRQLVTGGHDAEIRVWDLQTGELSRTIRGHRGSVNDFDFSPGDKLLASSSNDRTVRLWDFESGQLLATLEGHEQPIYGVRFSPDGKLLASGSWDATIKLWDVEKRAERSTLPLKLEPLAVATPLRRAARRSFSEGDFDKGHQQLTELLAAWRQQPGGSAFEWSQLLGDVAHEYIRIGKLDEALTILGEAADLNLPCQTGSDQGLANAAAGLHRRLADLPAEQRYELLHAWSMPTQSRRTVRMLTSRTPTAAPPSAFARVLGERPRRDSFPIADVGGVHGLFSTAWELVQAAEASGHLRQLTSEAERFVGDSVSGSQVLATLARIAAADRPSDELLDHLQQFTSNTAASSSHGARGELVMAAACLEHEWLWSVSQEIVDAFAELQASDAPPEVFRLRQAYATALLHRGDSADPPHFPDWIPAAPARTNVDSAGASQDVWLSHEDSIMRLAGAHDACLLFQYPLVGDFTLSCEAIGEGKDRPATGIAYNGLAVGASGPTHTFNTWGGEHRPETRRSIRFLPNMDQPLTQRLSLKSATDGTMTVSVNGHPVWSGNARDRASPWIGLWSASGYTPIYHNVRIIGTPMIPREIRLSDDDELRGWSWGEAVDGPPSATDNAVWYGKDGVICGADAGEQRDTATPSRLSYLRPLQDGDSISYEFLHEPGRYHVHPALGRLAFLIEPDGVQIHWMVGGDADWTGLPDDNAVIEPLNRRGPKPLPLVAGSWHNVRLSIDNGTLTLSLGDSEIYTRKVEAEDDRRFSFYHDRSRSAVRVRNVVLRGDWPDKLPAEQLDNLTRSDDSLRGASQRRVLGELFDERHVAGAGFRVHQQAATMPTEERYKFLSNWVLPGPDHDTLRLAMDFAPANPAPPVQEGHPFDEAQIQAAIESGETRILTGGFTVAPAIDLIATAQQLGKLDEVRSRLERAPDATEIQQRRRLAMLLLTDMAQSEFEPALARLDDLHRRVQVRALEDFPDRWPETLAVWMAIHPVEMRDAARGLLAHMLQNQVRDGRSRGPEQWDHMIAAAAGRLQYFDRVAAGGQSPGRFASAPALKTWSPVCRSTARTRGSGFPQAHWTIASSTVEKLACHDDDYLMYRIPLRGDFELECDATGFSWRHTQLCVAGTWVTPRWDHNSYEVGSFRETDPPAKIEPQLSRVGDWVRYRVVVRDGVCTTYFNGRRLHDEPLPDEPDPWLSIRSPWNAQSAVRGLRITGAPVIPDRVRLSALADLPGWIAYYNETVGGDEADWRHDGTAEDGGGLVGRRKPELAGTGQESLLRYQRPMLEDGTIEYDFYYREGEVHVHPALDRRAFILHPDGVRLHWLTDDVYDRTGLDPLNIFDEPQYRRGPQKLPLAADDWNHLQLTLSGDTVLLTLNDQDIYQCDLEPTNQRTLGLFHYSDRTEARVRNIVWQGDWPRELPPVAQQELAGSPTDEIDAGLPQLTARVHHDFAEQGLPGNRFGPQGMSKRPGNLVAKSDGLHLRCPGVSGYASSGLGARLRVHGDFDITATFYDLTINEGQRGSGAIALTAILENDSFTRGIVQRAGMYAPGEPVFHFTQTEFFTNPMGQPRIIWLGTTAEETTSGRLRLARRGSTLYGLLAEGNSSQYRLVHVEKVGDESLIWEGVRLTAAVQADGNPLGSTSVIWKDLTIRAERITDWPGKIANAPATKK